MVSHIGKEAILNYLKQTGAKNFKIFLDNSKYPLYTSLSKSNNEALKQFSDFSDNIIKQNKNDDNVYHLIVLRDNVVKGNNVLSEAYFKFFKESDVEYLEPTTNVSGFNEVSNAFSMLDRMIKLVQPFANQRAENEILKRQVEDIEEESEEKPDYLGSIINAVLPTLMKTKELPTVAGMNGEVAEINNDILTQAITILAKYDPQLDKDLMKLADIAQKSPEQFKMLLSMLRNMNA